MNLKIDDSPTVTFSCARRPLSSANVISGCSATNRLTSSSCAARAYPLYPPNLAGLTLPVSRCSLRKRTTELILTPSCSAVSGMVAPSCPAPTTRPRRSSEYGFAIHAGLHPAGESHDSVFSVNALAASKCAAGIRNPQIGEHGFPGDRGLPDRDHRRRAIGEIDVEARAEADHAEALAGADRLALAHEADDAARHQAGDLHHGDARAGGGDHQRIALIVGARLVEVGVEELAWLIDDFLDAAGDRAAVHVAVEHAHEDRDARQRLVAQPELVRRRCRGDLADAAIGGRHHQALAHRGHPRRIAEEIGAPQGRQRAEPAERAPQPEQHQAGEREGADKGVAFRRDRHDLRANRIVARHVLSYSAASAGASNGTEAASVLISSTCGGLRLGATSASPASASFSRASSASRWRFHMLA